MAKFDITIVHRHFFLCQGFGLRGRRCSRLHVGGAKHRETSAQWQRAGRIEIPPLTFVH